MPPLDSLRALWSSRSPSLLFAVKSALAGGLSWGVVSLLLGKEAAALAMVSAVIVVQVTGWQTVRKGMERILGVMVGVILAVLVAHLLGVNIWTTTLMIFFAQIVGMFLQDRSQYLATQIPISAALALVLGVTASNYPLLRVLGALVGGLIGTVMSLVLSPPVYVFRARDAVAELASQVADVVPALADALAGRLGATEGHEVYMRIRRLEQRVRATEQAYSLGVDSARLNPWARHARHLLVDFPDILLALDRLVRQMRRIAYTINEPEPSWDAMAQHHGWADDYAGLLREMGSILAATAGYARASAATQGGDLPAREALGARVEHARRQIRAWQDHLVRDVRRVESPTGGPISARAPVRAGQLIALRGAILTDLRRMLDEVGDVVEMTFDPSLRDHGDGPAGG